MIKTQMMGISQDDVVSSFLLKQVLEEEFSLNQSLMNSVESTATELSKTPKGSVYLKVLKDLEQIRLKWTTIHTKFVDLKEQPGKKLDAEFDKLHGQTLTDLDKIHRGVKKLKLESAEPRNIKGLLDKCMVSCSYGNVVREGIL